jgi:2-iminobutanoate/2-iminopropanoate deaminase
MPRKKDIPVSAIATIVTDKAPGAVGPYSQAVAAGNFIFTSGQLPVDPVTGSMPDDVKAQTAVCLGNIRNILEAAGSSPDKVVKAVVYLADIKDFPLVNEVYAGFFKKPFPARSCFAVNDLPLGAKVEIEVVAAT